MFRDRNRGDRIDATSTSARRYDYWLGGKDNFAADRAAGDELAEAFPAIIDVARENRAFLRRSVQFLAESGVRQFLDVGAGLPAADPPHEVAQRTAPESRVVYVDHDPMVISHARARLLGDPRGRIACLLADARDAASILDDPELRETLDLDQPIGLLMVSLLHYIFDDAEAMRTVRDLMCALAPGSYLVITHGTLDFADRESAERYESLFAAGVVDACARPKTALDEWLTGLEIVDPGIVPVADWRPDGMRCDRSSARAYTLYAAAGRLR